MIIVSHYMDARGSVQQSEDVISQAPGRLMRQMMQLRPWIADAASDGHEEMQRFEPVAPLPVRFKRQ